MRQKESAIRDKSIEFAIRVVKLCRYLNDDKKEYILSKQLLRSGTAIGALVREADYAESKADFIHKIHIATKEGSEAEYWILLLFKSGLITEKEFESIQPEINQINRILVSILKTSKTKSIS